MQYDLILKLTDLLQTEVLGDQMLSLWHSQTEQLTHEYVAGCYLTQLMHPLQFVLMKYHHWHFEQLGLNHGFEK